MLQYSSLEAYEIEKLPSIILDAYKQLMCDVCTAEAATIVVC